MNQNEAVVTGILGMFLQDGLYIKSIDHINKQFFFTIPKDSYAYHEENEANIKDAVSYAKRIKEMLIEMKILTEEWKCFYKIRDVVWTKEMGDENFKNNIGQTLTFLLGRNMI